MVQHIMPRILAVLSVLIVSAIMVEAQPKGELIAKPELDPSCISHNDNVSTSWVQPAFNDGRDNMQYF